MELDHLSLYIFLFTKIFLCVKGQVTFNPDDEIDIQLQLRPIYPPVEVTTVQCYTSSPTFRAYYATLDGTEDVNIIKIDNLNEELQGSIANGGTCGQSQNQYKLPFSALQFIVEPKLVGGTFRLRVTLDNNKENSTLSKTTYSFPAPFNLTGSSVSAVLGSPFTWTCHVTSDYPVIEWYRDNANLGQMGIPDGVCVTTVKNDTYTYGCQPSAFTYTLTITGSSLTEKLQGTAWRCKKATGGAVSELKGSKFIKLDIVVPVTTVTISPGGSGSILDVDENQMIPFTCITNDANPTPVILWHIGSSDVPSQVGSNRTTLTVNVTRAEHQMSVRCKAWNSGNTVNLSDSTTLNVRFPPAGNEQLGITGYTIGQVLYENNPAMISMLCKQPGGNPVANMTFTCGLEKTGTNESTTTDAIQRLNLTNDRNLNGENCTCVSTHINGFMRNESFSIIVYYPPSTPNISISSPFPWKANGSQNLTCNTTPGNPPATTYIWKVGGSVSQTTSQTYSINSLQPNDNGRQLQCQVNNNFTLHQTVVINSNITSLQVQFPPENDQELQIVGYTNGLVLYENKQSMINISCTQLGGNPVVNMTFTCGSETGTKENTAAKAIRRLSLTKDRSLNGERCDCVSTHINGYTRNKRVTFIVYYPPSTPNISLSSPPPWKATGTYNLTCDTTPGNPGNTTYIWTEEGSEQLKSKEYTFKPLNSTDNRRQLRCRVNNNYTLHENMTLTSDITTLHVEYDPVVNLSQSSIEKIEGQTAEFRCTATGNPAPNILWYRGSTPVTDINISSSVYTILNTNRTFTGNYTCRANSSSTGSNELQPDQKTAYLRVFYPPTVSLYLQNTTEYTTNHVVRCSAAGDPNNATIVALQQRIGSTLIRNITSFTESSPGNMTLNIDPVSYQDMGTYTCLASNGIPDRSDQKIQSDTGYLNIITSAKFEMVEYTVRSDIDSTASKSIPFYRNPPANESDIMWVNNTGTSNETLVSSANVSLSLSETIVNRTLHGVDVTLHGQSAKIYIPTFQDYYEGNYTLKVKSSHTGSVEVRIALIRSGPPYPPSDFQLLTRKVTSVVLTWNKGSDGGHPQTFVILYKEKTAEVYKREELNDTSTKRNITYEIKSLKTNTNYDFLLYSFNEKGNSTGYKTLEEMTLKAPVVAPQSSLNSGLVGGAAGGGAAVLVVVIVIIVVMRRRHNHGKGRDSKGILNSTEMLAGTSRQNDYDDGEDGLKDNPLYVSSTSEVNVAQGASAEPENPSLYAEVVKPKKKSPAKETVDPPPLYAEVNKSKEKNGKGQLKPKKKSPAKGGEDPPPIYAEVDKSDKKKDKGKQKKQKAKGKMEGDVYENVDGFKEKETQFNDPAEKQDTKEPRGYRNQDGLLYIDVKFDQPPQKGKPIIHGEERTGYAMIEFEEPPTYSTADDVKGAEGGK